MWHPSTWNEVEALKGHAEESSTLDFKRQIGSNPEIAKDLAAMALNGGVLVYGVEEDKDTGVAAEIKPVPLKQVEERIRQIAGSGVSPPVDLDVHFNKGATWRPCRGCGRRSPGVTACASPGKPSVSIPAGYYHRLPGGT